MKLELFSGFAATTQPSADTIFSRYRLEVSKKNSHIIERWAHDIDDTGKFARAPSRNLGKIKLPMILSDTTHSAPEQFCIREIIGRGTGIGNRMLSRKIIIFWRAKWRSNRGSHPQLIIIPAINRGVLIDRVLTSGLTVKEQFKRSIRRQEMNPTYSALSGGSEYLAPC